MEFSGTKVPLVDMRRILQNMIITFLFLGCIQNNELNNKNGNKIEVKNKTQNQLQKDSFKLRVFMDKYSFSFQEKILEAKNEEQLSAVLKENYNMRDTLYVFVGYTHEEKIMYTLDCLRQLKIKNKIIILEKSYFRFPYRKE